MDSFSIIAMLLSAIIFGTVLWGLFALLARYLSVRTSVSTIVRAKEKPTEVFAIPMRIHTQPGDICFEPFSGSGSQIIAGERLHRRVFALELEPIFCDVAVKRWEDFTGKKAVLEQK